MQFRFERAYPLILVPISPFPFPMVQNELTTFNGRTLTSQA